MGKGGSSEVKETSQQKAAAEVANKQWNLYTTQLKPFETMLIGKMDNLNNESKYSGIAADTNLQYQQAFGQAGQQQAQSLASAGVDPSSGKFQGAMDKLTNDQIAGNIDTTSRAQNSQQDKYIAGQQDIVAMGAGQQADAIAGYQNIAANSAARARNDAQQSLANSNATGSLIGTGLGLAASYGSTMIGNGGATAPKSTGSSSGVFGSQQPASTGIGLGTGYKSYVR